MGELGFAHIIVVIGFVVLVLVKSVLQQARRRAETRLPEEEPVMQTRRKVKPAPAPPSATRAPRSRVREPQVPNVRPPIGGRQSIRKSLLETPHDVQRGIILMTILGPCRAFDPPD